MALAALVLFAAPAAAEEADAAFSGTMTTSAGLGAAAAGTASTGTARSVDAGDLGAPPSAFGTADTPAGVLTAGDDAEAVLPPVDPSPRPFISAEARRIEDIQTIQNLNRARTARAVVADSGVVPVPVLGGVVRGDTLEPRQVITRGTAAVPDTPLAGVVGAGTPTPASGAVSGPYVSLEGQRVSAPASPAYGEATPAEAAPSAVTVGTVIDVDPPRSEITVSDHFSGDNVTLVVEPGVTARIDEGAVVKVTHGPGSNRATDVDVRVPSAR